MSCIDPASCCAGAARSLARLDLSADAEAGARSGTVGKSGVGRGMTEPFPAPPAFPAPPPALAPPPREAPPPLPPCAAATCVGDNARDETNASRLTAFWIFIGILFCSPFCQAHTVLFLRPQTLGTAASFP